MSSSILKISDIPRQGKTGRPVRRNCWTEMNLMQWTLEEQAIRATWHQGFNFFGLRTAQVYGPKNISPKIILDTVTGHRMLHWREHLTADKLHLNDRIRLPRLAHYKRQGLAQANLWKDWKISGPFCQKAIISIKGTILLLWTKAQNTL